MDEGLGQLDHISNVELDGEIRTLLLCLPRGVSGVVVVCGSKTRVTLNVNVERSAEIGVITLGSAVLGVVGGQGVETDITVSRYGSIEVAEDLSVLSLVGAGNNSSGSRCHRVERSV